jgi:hypothetical protein
MIIMIIKKEEELFRFCAAFLLLLFAKKESSGPVSAETDRRNLHHSPGCAKEGELPLSIPFWSHANDSIPCPDVELHLDVCAFPELKSWWRSLIKGEGDGSPRVGKVDDQRRASVGYNKVERSHFFSLGESKSDLR